MGYGNLREWLTIQVNDPPVLSVTSLTRASATATAQTATAHEYTTGDYVTIAGATPTGYNGKWKITVTGPTTFTYACNATLATPATGTITVVYVSDAQGGHEIGWTLYRTIAAEMLPVGATERLQAEALHSRLEYRFRIHAIDAGGITAEMRAQWTPQWPPAQPMQTLEIHGVVPDGDGRQFTLLECAAGA
jgi:head-tail adaptor